MDALKEGFSGINQAFAKLANATNMPSDRVFHRYTQSRTFSTGRQNMWNVYQAYFTKNIESECTEMSNSEDEKEGMFRLRTQNKIMLTT